MPPDFLLQLACLPKLTAGSHRAPWHTSGAAQHPLQKRSVDPNSLMSHKPFEISRTTREVQVWGGRTALPQLFGQHKWKSATKLSHTPKEERPWSN